MQYEWINNVIEMSNGHMTFIFHDMFDEKIEPNTLPKNLTSLTFGHNFNQKIDSEMLPANLKNINFKWLYLDKYEPFEYHIEMINNIPSYYHVELFLKYNILGNHGLKWPIHVVNYEENKWPSEIYEIQNKYIHPIYDSIIVLINKESYQPYSSVKSALK